MGLNLINEQMLTDRLKQTIHNGSVLNVYKNSSTTIHENNNTVPFVKGEIKSFSPSYDKLVVYCNGLLVSPEDYTITEGDIVKKEGTWDSESKFDFLQIKNGSLETALVGKTNIYRKELTVESNTVEIDFLPTEVESYNGVTDTFLLVANTVVLIEGEHYKLSADETKLVALPEEGEEEGTWYEGTEIFIYYFRGLTLDPGIITNSKMGIGCSLKVSGNRSGFTASEIEWNDESVYRNDEIKIVTAGRYRLNFQNFSSEGEAFIEVNGVEKRISLGHSLILPFHRDDVVKIGFSASVEGIVQLELVHLL